MSTETNETATPIAAVEGAADAAIEDVEHLERFIMPGLVTGRLVSYFLKDKTPRPFLVLNPGDQTGAISGILFFDGVKDSGNLVHTGPSPSGQCFAVVDDVQKGTEPGQWNWPQTAPVPVPDSAGDITAEEVDQKLKNFLDSVIVPRVQATLDTVNAALDSHNAIVTKIIDRASDIQKSAPDVASITKAIEEAVERGKTALSEQAIAAIESVKKELSPPAPEVPKVVSEVVEKLKQDAETVTGVTPSAGNSPSSPKTA